MNSEADIHVLHVDDEPGFAELTTEFLKRENDNFTVTTATSANKGIEHLSRGDFDCIVSDYDMPTQNGIDFLESVRKNLSDLPFVLFTGKGSEEIAGKAISAGVTDYIQKKSGTDQYTVLANRLRNAVQRYRAEKDRKRQRKAIETAQEGISILNEDGEYIYVNQAYADIYGYEPDEMAGKHWDLIYPDDETAIARDVILPTVAEDGYWRGETTGLRADGTTFLEDHTVTRTETGELICSVRDRSVEQEQEVELTQFRTLVETLNDPVYVVDETGQFEYVNDAFIEMVGYDRETIIGASPALIKSPEAVDRSEDHLGRILSSNGPDSVQFEIEILPNQDGPILCEDHMGVLPYEGESFEGSVGILRDISQQKEREAMLQKYQYAYESALNGIAMVNLDGEITDVNSAFIDMWGYESEDDILGRPATSMWSDPKRAKSVLETVTDQGSRQDELEAVRADGSTFYARGVNSYLRDTDDNPIGVIASFFDITERREREAKLETQAAAMEASMDGIAILNAAGEYTYMNQAHADVFDYDADTLIGSSWQRLYDDDEITRIEQEVFSMLEDEGTWRGETVGTRHDGSNVYQEITLSLLDDGKLIYTTRDITERKRREQELEQTNTVLRTIVETLPMGVLVEDTKRDVLIANDHLGETLGIPADGEELIGRDCATAAEEIKSRFTDPEAFIEGITERLEQRKLVQNEELHLTDGRVVERDYVPYTLPEGEANLWLYQDVTARKQQSQELERANEFLSQTQAVADVGGWELDLQTESLRWTDEVYRIHDVGPEFEPTVEDAIAFYHPEDQTTIQDAVEQVTTEGEAYDLELRIVTADDEVRWVSARGKPRYEDGKIVGVRGTFQDITDRMEREQELYEEQAFIERSLDALEDIFYFVNPDGEFQRWNSKLSELTGYSDEEIGSMNALEFFDGEHREAISHSIQEILETGPHLMEAEITTTNGRQVPHEFRGVRMTNDDGEPTGVIGIARNITERRERERQLEQQTEELEQLATKYELQYRTLFEEAPVMTILTRSEDGQPIIEDCNSQFVETLGYDADTIAGSELTEFYTPESAERLQSKGYSQALNGQFTREERELLTIDGETVEVLLRAVPRRRADGEIIGTVAMYIDISERESVKRANERLEEFASVVSHDLRNPLNVATGRLKLAAEECDSDHLDNVEDALGRMEALIDELLTLAREGKEVTDALPVHLATIADECWENVKTHQAKLLTNTDQVIQADRSRLKQVFENLFRNAVEHGRADVTVTIGGLDDGFYIEDDGPGIPSDERDAVFEAGYSKSTDGTGFGLSIVEQVVTAHNWQIRITDGTDGGTRFEITNAELVELRKDDLHF